MRRWVTILLMGLFIVAAGCSETSDSVDVNQPEGGTANDREAVALDGESGLGETDQRTSERFSDEELVMAKADQVLRFLADRDIDNLADLVHPVKGVRISPYAFVNIENDVTFTKEQLKEAWESEDLLVWGSYDGSGNSIEASFRQFYESFIYDVDFLKADEVSYNQRIGIGNMVSNAFEAYPDANIVEYYVAGIDEEAEGMDWRSLRLAFEQYEGEWQLVGIIHDQWAI